MIRNAIVNFVVGACIRRIQQEKAGERQRKYSFVIHTEQTKSSHDWQVRIVDKIKSELVRILNNDVVSLDNLVKEAYSELAKSMKLRSNLVMPDLAEVKEEVKKSLKDDYLAITKVNSDKEVNEILDTKTGQLNLLNPLNIFVGGQILDRGITVDNLIGFYYGRNPKKPQQDTVLQHSRMYGARSEDDLSVTRFYTTLDIYQTMKKINEFDSELRKVLENGNVEQQGVYFIRKDDQNKLLPCSPNKILLSDITTLRPFKRLLPIGFQTGYKSNIRKTIEEIDNLISKLGIAEKPGLVDIGTVKKIISLIYKTLEFDDGYKWDVNAFIGSMEYLSNNSKNKDLSGKVWCLIRRDRNISQKKPMENVFSYTPDNPEVDQKIAKEYAIDVPTVGLFRENGKEGDGWRGSEFWWPVLYVPKNVKTVIFESGTAD